MYMRTYDFEKQCVCICARNARCFCCAPTIVTALKCLLAMC